MQLIFRTCAGTLAALLALPVMAEPAAPPHTPPHTPDDIARGSSSSVAPAAAPADMLDKERGGSDGIASDTRVQGSVYGNAATNVSAGANVIQASSFANAAGIPVVIQNSGANVLIQNATVINLQFK
jgi:hypothetical protein